MDASKVWGTSVAGVRKKFLKGKFQLVFEFINKVILPRLEERTIAYTVDLYVIEFRSKFELISLLAFMIEHMHKVIHKKEKRYGISYGYFLNRVYEHFRVVDEKGTPRTVKQMFSLITLIENKCVKEKVGTMSQVCSRKHEEREGGSEDLFGC